MQGGPGGPRSTVTFVCPKCKGSLQMSEDSMECLACSAQFSKLDGFPCFTAEYEEAQRTHAIPSNELVMGKRAAAEFLVPLLTDLFAGSHHNGLSVLDVGCGSGEIANTLRVEHSYDCWGIDLGYRRLHWKNLAIADSLAVASGASLPFEDESFDFVYSFGVIEHVGAAGPGMLELTEEYTSIRQDFVRELLRVTKAGGYVLLTCPNRCFPIDFFHRTNSLGMRFHSWTERLLLSYGDLEKLLIDGHDTSVSTLPLDRYFGFSWAERGKHQGLRKILVGPGRLYLGFVSSHHLLRSSFLAPFLLVLGNKRS